jgi:hypothetical protein
VIVAWLLLREAVERTQSIGEKLGGKWLDRVSRETNPQALQRHRVVFV